MPLVAGLDFGGGAVKACVADVDRGEVLAVAQEPTETSFPAPGRAEFDPHAWWRAATVAMRAAVSQAARPPDDYGAVSVTSLRQGYVLLDDDGELGAGVVNADRRGADHLGQVRETIGRERLYEITGHWSAPQLTLPKLLEEQRSGRLQRARTMLFVHDWALWRLCGERVSEPSMASAGQLLDVHRRTWAREVLGSLGLDPSLLPRLVDAGTRVGRLRDPDLGLPGGIDVIAGGGDTQLAATGAGGLADGVVSVVAGTTTPLQASTAEFPRDPEQHPWVSAHLRPDRWAAETNAGYTGMSLDWFARISGTRVSTLADEAAVSPAGAKGITAAVTARIWSEETWSSGAPGGLIGFEPGHARADVARAFIEAHAYGIRGNLEDLERATGKVANRICLLGGASGSRAFTQLVADTTGRPIGRVASDYPAGRAFAWLAASAGTTESSQAPPFIGETVDPRPNEALEEGYVRYTAAGDALRQTLPGWTA
jgi:sugar (pentulose or hexulose) kinase